MLENKSASENKGKEEKDEEMSEEEQIPLHYFPTSTSKKEY